METEPSVLCIEIQRASVEHAKDGTAVQRKSDRLVEFPEYLDFMRSGPYKLHGFIQHVGDHAERGHYTATVRLRDCTFGLFDDGNPVVPKYAHDFVDHHVQRQVCVLQYVRQSFWESAGSIGLAPPPYMIGEKTAKLYAARP